MANNNGGADWTSVFYNIVVSFIMTAIQQAFAPTPKGQVAQKGELQVNTASEDAANQMHFGTVQVAGNVIWSGDDIAEPVKQTQRVSWFKKVTNIVAWRRRVGLWLSLSVAPVDKVLAVKYGDRTVWSGDLALSKDAITALNVNSTWFSSEGQEVPDGMQGRLSFFNHAVADLGAYVPLDNAYMKARLGLSRIPAYPNTCHVVWHGPSDNGRGFLGTSPYIDQIRFILKRLPNLADAFPNSRYITYPVAGSLAEPSTRTALNAFLASVEDIEGDANPALAMLEILTTRVSGVGPKLNTWGLNVESFLRAAERLKAEGNGVSFSWSQSQAVSEVLSAINRQIQAELETNEHTGQIQLKLIRQDDAPVYAFDDSNIVEITSFSRIDITEAPNSVSVKFEDRELNWAVRNAIAPNPAGYKAAGTEIAQEAEFIGATRAALAQTLANREVLRVSTPIAQMAFSARIPKGLVLKPGDLVLVQNTPLQQGLRMRVASARFASYENRTRIELECVEDVFRSGTAFGASVLTRYDVPTGVSGNGARPNAMWQGVAVVAPRGLHGQDYDQAMYWAVANDGTVSEYQTLVKENVTSWDATVPTEYADGTNSPAVLGALTATVSTTNESPTITLSLNATQVSVWQLVGRSTNVLCYMNGEWLMSSSVALVGSTLTLSNVQRGLFDSVPKLHAAGAYCYVLTDFYIDDAPMRTAINDAAESSGYLSGGSTDGMASIAFASIAKSAGGQSYEAAYSGLNYWFSDSRARRPIAPGRVELSGVAGSLDLTETAPGVARAPTLKLKWKNRSAASTSQHGYFSQTNNPDGARLKVQLEYLNNDGYWVEAIPYQFFNAANASEWSTPVSIAAGERKMRATITAFYALDGSGLTLDKSMTAMEIVRAYWTVSA